MPTIPRVKCTYFLLIEDKCDFTNDTNTEIYGKLVKEVIETYPDGGLPAIVPVNNDLNFEMTIYSNQLSLLNGSNPNRTNLSVIDLGDCAKKLIQANHLPENTDLIILKLENLSKDKNGKSVQYEVYVPGTGQKLDLSVCSDTKIEIIYPVVLDDETKKLYDDLKAQGYDLFDKNNKFYTDICTPYKSDDGTDIILADRNNDFFAKHEIVCQANCEFSSYNDASSYVSCKCDAVESDRMEAEEPAKVTAKTNFDSFVDILAYSNYKVLYCYKLVFRAVTFYKNFGSILTMLYFIGYCISFGFFWYNGFLTPLKIEIAKLFKKKHDIRNLRSNIDNDKNKIQNLNKITKVNIVSNTKLKEVFDKNSEKNKNIKSIGMINASLKSNDLIDSKMNMNITNSKSNLKRSLKNRKNNRNVHMIGLDNKEIKDKERMERDKNVTFEESKKENIAIKSYKNQTIKTKVSKEGFPPKKKMDLIDKMESVEDNNLKSNLDSEKKLNDDIIIHKSKNTNKDLSSIDKKSLTKEDVLLMKDAQKTNNINLSEEKPSIYPGKKEKKIYDDFELNHLEYSEALKDDHRIFLRIYWSLLKREHPIIHTFLAWNDYNLFFVKLSKFFFLVTTIMALDALFYSNDAMHDIYSSGGSFNFGPHAVQMVLSIIIYEVFQILLNYLTLTDIDYYKIKGKKDTISQKEVISIIKCIKYKMIGFYVSTFLIFLFYWYLDSAFCAVYEYTQGPFAIDTFVCLIFAWIYDLALYLIPTGLRKISFVCLRMKGLKIIYRISQFIPVF